MTEIETLIECAKVIGAWLGIFGAVCAVALVATRGWWNA